MPAPDQVVAVILDVPLDLTQGAGRDAAASARLTGSSQNFGEAL